MQRLTYARIGRLCGLALLVAPLAATLARTPSAPKRPLAASAALRPAADLVVHHARIYTRIGRPEAQALAVLDGRLVAVGDEAAVQPWIGPRTTVVDAHDGRIVPGFNDAHVHFADGGFSLDAVQLNDATSPDEFVARLKTHAATRPPGEWILEGEWDETKWPGGALPTRELIDAATPRNPVAISRYDGHMVLANSLALKLAGITAATPDPVGGIIVRNARGEPTGALKDAAQNLVMRAVPAPTAIERRHRIERALGYAASLGVTSVQDMAVDYGDLAAYAALAREGRLTARIYVAPLIEHVDDEAPLGLGAAFGNAWLRIGALKAFADGSLGSRTAFLFDDYSDEPGNRGLLADTMHPLERTLGYLLKADGAQLQVCTHAIGDGAISTMLDLYAEVIATNGPRDRRWRIEHAQHIAAKDLDRFAALGVVASMQPTQAIDDGRWAERRVGADRASRTYAFRSLADRGAHLAFGTDWPVAPLDPILGLYAAVTRATLDGQHPDGWVPAQKITLSEAVDFYTRGSAFAEFTESDKGTLEVGRLADFVLLSADIFALEPAHIRDARVLGTWVGGRRVYTAAP